MIIYRVQNALDGRGPWRHGFSNIWVDHSRSDEQMRKLAAWQDQFVKRKVLRKAKANEHVGCGCISSEQLRLWFTEQEYNYLLSFGYHAVKILDARILAQSDVQCIFARRRPLREGVVIYNLYAKNERMAIC